MRFVRPLSLQSTNTGLLYPPSAHFLQLTSQVTKCVTAWTLQKPCRSVAWFQFVREDLRHREVAPGEALHIYFLGEMEVRPVLVQRIWQSHGIWDAGLEWTVLAAEMFTGVFREWTGTPLHTTDSALMHERC